MKLNCVVAGPGAFSDELVITVTDIMGHESSYFVPRQSVTSGVEVRVYEREGVTWIVLPDELNTHLAVNKKDLRA